MKDFIEAIKVVVLIIIIAVALAFYIVNFDYLASIPL